MDSCRETAFCLTLWYAFLTLLAAVLLIVLNDLDAPTALLAAANVALLFALVLMARAGRLTERSVVRGQFWRTLPERQRPAGEAGVRLARRALQETWLTFAKGAAVVAVALASLAYVSNWVSPAAWADAVRTPVAQSAPGNTSGYRSARLLPMN
jgi:hypothetical protein